MAKKIGGLGKGLGALGLGKNAAITKSLQSKVQDTIRKNEKIEAESEPKQAVTEIALKDISANPNQPRTEFDEAALESLKESVKQYGVLQPVLVRKTAKGYELIAGERRFRASQLAGLEKIPALVREYNDAQMTEVALIENIQRENLNPIEEAFAYQHLLSDYGLTQEMLSNKIGRSRPHIANFLRLLKLSEHVQDLLANGRLSMGQAKPLLSLEEHELQDKAADYILANELSVRKVEALVKHLQKQPDYLDEKENAEAKAENDSADVFYAAAEDKLKMLLGTAVRIKKSGSRQKVEIDFASQDELNHLIALLEQLNQPQQQELSNEEKIARLRAFSTTGKFTV